MVLLFQFGSVLFRPTEKKDLQLLHTWENDAELMMYSRSRPLNFRSVTQLENQFEERLKEEGNLYLMIELIKTQEPIGTARLEQRDWGNVKTGHLGTYIAKKELWGKGLGRQITVALLEMAFIQLNAERCDAGSVEYNTRAHRTLTACGFKKSGTYRKVHYVNGQKWDHFYFDLLREEYMKVRMDLLKQTLGDKTEQYLEASRILEPER
ncbi:MAG: GNAT family N-acetyltransferase [Candidatus Bathyarchaeota archaeon]|nr:GNAT family N-acetyltransferase [Candidatus Bathyarchaeota archaeon]